MSMRFSAGQRMSFPTDCPTSNAVQVPLSWKSLLFVGLLAAGCSSPVSREETFAPQTIKFDSTEVGQLPPDFSTALTGGGGPIAWAVREDSTAPDSKRVLVQESAEATNYRFPLCIYEKTVAR